MYGIVCIGKAKCESGRFFRLDLEVLNIWISPVILLTLRRATSWIGKHILHPIHYLELLMARWQLILFHPVFPLQLNWEKIRQHFNISGCYWKSICFSISASVLLPAKLDNSASGSTTVKFSEVFSIFGPLQKYWRCYHQNIWSQECYKVIPDINHEISSVIY